MTAVKTERPSMVVKTADHKTQSRRSTCARNKYEPKSRDSRTLATPKTLAHGHLGLIPTGVSSRPTTSRRLGRQNKKTTHGKTHHKLRTEIRNYTHRTPHIPYRARTVGVGFLKNSHPAVPRRRRPKSIGLRQCTCANSAGRGIRVQPHPRHTQSH